MIEKLYKHAHILHQESEEIPELPIVGHVDNGNSIILSQEGRHLVIQPEAVPELCKLLKLLVKEMK